MEDISTVLATIRQSSEDTNIINLTYELEDYSERKLWHQLTLSLDEFYKSTTNELKVIIYNQFISKFAKKINSIKVVDYVLQSFGGETCLTKLVELREVVGTGDEEFDIYSNLHIARYYIELQKVDDSLEILDKLDGKFTGINNDFSAKINSAYYLTKCSLYKYKENYNLFYTNGLLYLSTAEIEINNTTTSFAFDLALSALLGDKIYNFGELILHDILQTLNPTYSWLYNLIINLNSGNLAEFNKWLQISLGKYPKLNQHQVFLNQKIIIMSLVELISLKSTLNKTLTFKEIMDFTNTDSNDVEHLIIKCFALNLFQGCINQIDEVLTVTWLQPRILNLQQIKSLYGHLKQWDQNVEDLGKDVYKNGGTIWAAN